MEQSLVFDGFNEKACNRNDFKTFGNLQNSSPLIWFIGYALQLGYHHSLFLLFITLYISLPITILYRIFIWSHSIFQAGVLSTGDSFDICPPDEAFIAANNANLVDMEVTLLINACPDIISSMS